ncbi:hypothetical protein M1N16_05790 [Nitrospinaceae bacterium]|nr:hypothetical protein [Nitrospinaceae bacterium]
MTRISSVSFFIAVFFWCSSAIAATHEHRNTTHNTTPHHANSPFDKNKEGLLLHCALKGHAIDQICPENLLNNNIQELIASDCGSHPLDASSDIAINYSRSLLAVNMRFQSNLPFTGQLIILDIYKAHPNIQSPIEHPPQHNI